MSQKNNSLLKGYILAFLSYALWGLLAIYWKQLSECLPLEILAQRIVWSFVTLLLITIITKKYYFLSYLKNKKTRRALYITAVLISINWFVYIIAVNINHVIEASLGYYINPLICIFLGRIILKEKINKAQGMAILLAALGVIYLTISYGTFPYISILLAISFGLYGLFKKLHGLDSINSLLVEVLMVLPFAIGYIIYLINQDTSHLFTLNIKTDLFLILSGIVTIVPLYLFAEGAKRIPLSSIGFLQYVSPTLILLSGVFFFHEPFTTDHMISFLFIWSGLIIYTISIFKSSRGAKKEQATNQNIE